MQKAKQMTKQLFIITYESSTWCGASDTFVCVWALDKDDAYNLASKHMEEEMRNLFSDEYAYLIEEESEGADEDCAYTVISIEVLDEYNEQWKHYQNLSQVSFYPIIGSPK